MKIVWVQVCYSSLSVSVIIMMSPSVGSAVECRGGVDKSQLVVTGK